MPTRANKRSGLVFVLRVNNKTTSWPASRCSFRRSPQRLVSLPLLILVAAALTTIHSESFQLQKFPSFLWPPNQTQMQYTNYDSPLPASSKILPTVSPTVLSVYNTFSSHSTNSPDSSDKLASSEAESSTNTDIDSEKHFVLSHNNNSNHAILVRENTHHHYQQQQPHQKLDFYPPKSQIQQNLAVEKYPTKFSRTKFAERVAGQGSAADQIQHQYVVSEFNEKPNIDETNSENADQQQSRTSKFSSLVDRKEQVVATQAEALNQVENSKFSDTSKDDSEDDDDHKFLEKRFGFFKKGQQGNNYNNLPNYGTVSFHDECERCLHNFGLGPTQTASKMYESLPSLYRQHQQLAPSTPPHSGHFKDKFNKFLLQKPRSMGDYSFPISYLSSYNKYKPSGPVAYRTQLSQPFSCIQPANFAGLGPLMNQGLPDHVQLDDTKFLPQISYSNLVY